MTKIMGSLILGSALIWGATLIAVAAKLKGMEVKDEVVHLIGIAAGIHLILIWGPGAAMIQKMKLEQLKSNKPEKDNEGY